MKCGRSCNTFCCSCTYPRLLLNHFPKIPSLVNNLIHCNKFNFFIMRFRGPPWAHLTASIGVLQAACQVIKRIDIDCKIGCAEGESCRTFHRTSRKGWIRPWNSNSRLRSDDSLKSKLLKEALSSDLCCDGIEFVLFSLHGFINVTYSLNLAFDAPLLSLFT